MNRQKAKRLYKKSLPKTRFQEPISGYLGKTSDENADVIAGVAKLFVRLETPDSPEYDTALVSPMFMAYYASLLRPNLKVELTRTKRDDLKIEDIDIYHEIAFFGGSYPAPNLIINLEGEGITGILPVNHGGSGADLSATGAATHFVRQVSAGADFSVGAIVSADLTTALTTPPAIGGSTPAAGTFNPVNITTYAQFTEASTPSNPANTASRLFTRDVLTSTRMGFVDSTGLITDISRDRHIEANNATGSTIAALRVVRVNGASGSTPFQPTVTPAQANSAANVGGMIGVTHASITNGANGKVMLHGRLENVDTSGFAGVGEVYIDASTPGDIECTGNIQFC